MPQASDVQRQLLDAWNRRDWTTYRSFLHSEYTYIGADGKELVGPETGVRIGQKYAAAFPDGKAEITSLIVSGDTAVCEFTCRGTHGGELEGIAATGRPVEIRVVNIVELEDGKVRQEREYTDAMTIMAQIGALPATGSGAAAGS